MVKEKHRWRVVADFARRDLIRDGNREAVGIYHKEDYPRAAAAYRALIAQLNQEQFSGSRGLRFFLERKLKTTEDVQAEVPAARAYLPKVVLSDVAVKMSETRVPAIFGRIINAGDRGIDDVRLTVTYYAGRGTKQKLLYQESHSVIVTPIEFTGFVRPVLPFVPGETRDFGFELVAPAEIQQQSEPSLTVGSIIFTQSKAPLPTLAVENLAPGPEPSGSPSAAPATPTPMASPSDAFPAAAASKRNSGASTGHTRCAAQLTISLTLAVPTHNRAATLGQTLASLAAQSLPAGVEADCIVIDNASTDDTAAVVDDFARGACAFPMRRVFEPRPGSSFARNRAVDEAAARLHLLYRRRRGGRAASGRRELLDAMRRRGLDAACGMVLPRWSSPPPRGWGRACGCKLAVHDRARSTAAPAASAERLRQLFQRQRRLSSAICVRALRTFREDLGVVGGNPISGEDTELFARILERGGAMGFVAAARSCII